MSQSRLQILEDMGIPVWCKRSAGFFLDKPKAFAKLAVLLDKPLRQQNKDDKEARKVLKGMLAVLEINEQDYWIGWAETVPGAESTIRKELSNIVQTWMPSFVLCLGENWCNGLDPANDADHMEQLNNFNQNHLNPCSVSVYYTFHPEELIKMPEKKKKAYQSLLNLKKDLSLFISINHMKNNPRYCV